MRSVLIGIYTVIGVGLALAQLYVGYLGIVHHLGTVCGVIAVFLAVPLRFTLPVTVGAFLGAVDVLHWHWAWAFLFAVPGLIFMVPGAFFGLVGAKRR